jgi:hypothetical protein
MRVLLAIAVGLLGCSSSGPPAPTSCHKTDRHGTYLVTFTRLSGNCAEQTGGLVNIDAPSPSNTCNTISQTWSENDCKNDVVQNCEDGATITSVLHQSTQDGSVLDGTMTISLPNCIGTYSVHAARQ